MKLRAVGQVYRKQGFTFLVQGVDEDWVYLCKSKGKQSELLKVTHADWHRQMKEVEPERIHERN